MSLPFDAALKELVQGHAAFTGIVLRTGDSLLHLDFSIRPNDFFNCSPQV